MDSLSPASNDSGGLIHVPGLTGEFWYASNGGPGEQKLHTISTNRRVNVYSVSVQTGTEKGMGPNTSHAIV